MPETEQWRERKNSYWEDADYRDPAYLKQRYWENGLTSGEIAEECDVNPDTILKWLKKTGVGTRDRNERRRNWIDPSDELVESIEGLLLGDGYMGVGSEGGGAYFQEVDTDKEYIEWLKPHLSDLGLEGCIDQTHPDRENPYWRFTSSKVMDLRPVWDKWYGDDGKRIPDGIEITPTKMLFWYLGDGWLSESHGEPTVGIAVVTLSDGLSQVVRQLNDAGITCSKFSQGLRIWSESHEDFFEYIAQSPIEPPGCYSYKFL